MNELLYIMFFISKMRSQFHFSHPSMEMINIKLVQMENILFNLILESYHHIDIDIDEIIHIANKLSTTAKGSFEHEFIKRTSYNQQTYTKFFCMCVNISRISSTTIPM